MVLAINMAASVTWGRFSRGAARASGLATASSISNQVTRDSEDGMGTEIKKDVSLQQLSRDNLNNSQKGQAVAALMGAAFGAAAVKYGGICGGSGFTAYAACVTAGIMVGMTIQSLVARDSYKGPIDTSWGNVCSFSSLGCSGATPSNPYLSGQDPNLKIVNQNITQAQEKLRQAGFNVDPKTGKVKGPKGEVVDPSNPASLEAALGSSGSKALQTEISRAEQDAASKVELLKGRVNAALGLDGTGGGGGFAAVAGGDGYDIEGAGGANSRLSSGLVRERNPAQAKGLTKSFNGEPIGVSSDSIFEMMSRRYQLKTTQKTFINVGDLSN
jgi:hypothetical protein